MKNPFKGSKPKKESLNKLANSEYTQLYTDNKRDSNRDFYDDMYSTYLGTKHMRKNVNDQSNGQSKLANNVRNAGYEMIESQVNTEIPQVSVKSKANGFEWLAKNVQAKTQSDVDESNIQQIHDENERITPIYGLSMVMVTWDPSVKHHLYNGEKKFINIDPKQFIGQKRIYDIEKMDYFFIEFPTTKKAILAEYGVDVEAESEAEPGLNVLDDTTVNTAKSDSTDEMVTKVMMFYKDKDGDVGLYVFVNNVELLDAPKYYLPKVEVCQDCGEENPQGTKVCEYCESKKLKTTSKETETINDTLVLRPIEYTTKKFKVMPDKLDPTKKTVQEVEYTEVIERVVPKGTVVQRFKPTRYPISIRINTPNQYKFGGQSDLAVIYDQLVSLSKIISKIEEKIVRSGAIISVPEESNFSLTSEVYQVIKMSAADSMLLKVENLQADIQQDILYAREMYEILKSTLGITDSFQGKNEVSAESGKAKQLKIQQSAGRLGSKLFNKYNFYGNLFRIMFEFDLCFTGEIRPFVMKDSNGSDAWTYFDRHEFLVQDETGEWYYNTDFIVSADSGGGFESDKLNLLAQTKEQYQMQLIDKRQYWQQLRDLGYTNAKKMLDQLDETEGNKDKVNQLLQQMLELSPEQFTSLQQMPEEERMQYIWQIIQ